MMNKMNEQRITDFIARRHTENTAAAYRVAIEQFDEWVQKEFKDCTKKDFVQYTEFLSSKYKPATVMSKLAAIYSFYEFLAFMDDIESVPFNLREFRAAGILPNQKPSKKEFVEVSADGTNEVRTLIAAAVNLRQKAILMTLIGTGMRVSEMCDLTLSNYQNQTLYISKAKRDELRTVALDDSAAKVLDDYIQNERVKGWDAEWLFTDNYGQRLDRRTVSNWIARVSEKTLGKHITAHGLRHSCATMLIQNHVELATVQAQLGHKSPTTTGKYIHDIERTRFAETTRCTKNIW